MENIAGFYLIIGILYALINGAVRKLETDGDYFLPLVWIVLWPFGIMALIAKLITFLVEKQK